MRIWITTDATTDSDRLIESFDLSDEDVALVHKQRELPIIKWVKACCMIDLEAIADDPPLSVWEETKP